MSDDSSICPALSLDVTDLRCPLPVLKARKALAELAPGALLEVLTRDPGAAEDFAAFCQMTGHRLVVAQSDASEGQRFLIEKAGSRG